MSVPYQEALTSLQGMFSTFDRDIIAEILQLNKGHMEKTIDMLLEMSGETPINQQNTTDSDFRMAQMEQDEMLARMMQNELFRNDTTNTANNSRDYLPPELYQVGHASDRAPPQRIRPAALPRQNVEEEEEDDKDVMTMLEEDLNLKEIKVKFNQLGEAVKTKFGELSDYFTKKEDNNKYNPVNTSEEDENQAITNESVTRRNTVQTNDMDDEYDTFVLDDRRSDRNSSNQSSGGIKLRTFGTTSKKDE
ncbi:hypothetical protein SAMD00019534_000320 [Acytostelium subglobosum LB1]|uniref:hypothetical protein n=1 Tax=Acytostelium subglobosum LB1 TaxID=1410327 RepID=UPI0006450EC4|nr:hypothetical protein SAMD00019534_000320 [Acytostelium subglobosum LB1]GAM16857.1 hypothetical protein SAMD00019534_000320 [Acytostelium subglobosum LB1]|eukprot:XP_012758919.1 hypothetical protein SAMD00019534_000320 [Acytostelium subglobosum LB1]